MTALQKLFLILGILFGVHCVMTSKEQARAIAYWAERITGRRFDTRFDRLFVVLVGALIALGSLLTLLGIFPAAR